MTRVRRGLWPQEVVGNTALVGTEGTHLRSAQLSSLLGSRDEFPHMSAWEADRQARTLVSLEIC